MPFDKFVDIDKIDDDRRNSVMKSIRTINVEELKKLADEIFHSPGDEITGSSFKRNVRFVTKFTFALHLWIVPMRDAATDVT